MVKINIGCGWRDFGSDWVHIDGGDYKHLNYDSISDLSQYDNKSVDLIYASHVIEYFDREEVETLLLEWKRVLRDKGKLRVAVPNFETMAMLYASKQYSLESFLGPLYGKMKMQDTTIYHKTCYDFDNLSSLLNKLGFRDIVLYDWQQTEHAEFDDHAQSYLPHMDKTNGTLMSLNVECIK